jgi:hypothetical protein
LKTVHWRCFRGFGQLPWLFSWLRVLTSWNNQPFRMQCSGSRLK